MLTILDNTIHTVDGLYSLNDLHRASGGSRKHQANNFMRLESTRGLIHEIERSSDMRNEIKTVAYKVIQGGNSQEQGTFVCRELVYSYAMWISPRFQLLVIRAFDSMVTEQNQLSQQLNELCRDFNHVTRNLSSAGRFLSVAGKQIKPQLQRQIENTRIQMQPSLELIGGELL